MTLFDSADIAAVTLRENDPGIGDEIIARHNMTAAHVEILGQFLDRLGMDAEELMDFFDCYIDVVNSQTGGGPYA